VTLEELLVRKAYYYGFGTETELAEALGVSTSCLSRVLREKCRPGIGLRRAICRELDVAPEVLERVIRE
jgi:transcriptional regulator with XRE-family HTH domain